MRRATFWDPEKNAEDPAKKGICSNFLCDAKPGDEITMTGISQLTLNSVCCNSFGKEHLQDSKYQHVLVSSKVPRALS